MRNFLSHEYGDVDTEGIFNTVKTNIPELLQITRVIRQDLINGTLDKFVRLVFQEITTICALCARKSLNKNEFGRAKSFVIFVIGKEK